MAALIRSIEDAAQAWVAIKHRNGEQSEMLGSACFFDAQELVAWLLNAFAKRHSPPAVADSAYWTLLLSILKALPANTLTATLTSSTRALLQNIAAAISHVYPAQADRTFNSNLANSLLSISTMLLNDCRQAFRPDFDSLFSFALQTLLSNPDLTIPKTALPIAQFTAAHLFPSPALPFFLEISQVSLAALTRAMRGQSNQRRVFELVVHRMLPVALLWRAHVSLHHSNEQFCATIDGVLATALFHEDHMNDTGSKWLLSAAETTSSEETHDVYRRLFFSQLHSILRLLQNSSVAAEVTKSFAFLYRMFLQSFRAVCKKVDEAATTVDINANSLNRFKAKEEHLVLTSSEVAKRRKRQLLQSKVEICVLLDLLWLTSQTNEFDHGKSASDTSADKLFPWSLKFSQTTAKTNTAATSWRKAAAAVMTSSETERVIDGPFAIKEAVSNDELAAHTMLELLRVCENEKVYRTTLDPNRVVFDVLSSQLSRWLSICSHPSTGSSKPELIVEICQLLEAILDINYSTMEPHLPCIYQFCTFITKQNGVSAQIVSATKSLCDKIAQTFSALARFNLLFKSVFTALQTPLQVLNTVESIGLSEKVEKKRKSVAASAFINDDAGKHFHVLPFHSFCTALKALPPIQLPPALDQISDELTLCLRALQASSTDSDMVDVPPRTSSWSQVASIFELLFMLLQSVSAGVTETNASALLAWCSGFYVVCLRPLLSNGSALSLLHSQVASDQSTDKSAKKKKRSSNPLGALSDEQRRTLAAALQCYVLCCDVEREARSYADDAHARVGDWQTGLPSFFHKLNPEDSSSVIELAKVVFDIFSGAEGLKHALLSCVWQRVDILSEHLRTLELHVAAADKTEVIRSELIELCRIGLNALPAFHNQFVSLSELVPNMTAVSNSCLQSEACVGSSWSTLSTVADQSQCGIAAWRYVIGHLSLLFRLVNESTRTWFVHTLLRSSYCVECAKHADVKNFNVTVGGISRLLLASASFLELPSISTSCPSALNNMLLNLSRRSNAIRRQFNGSVCNSSFAELQQSVLHAEKKLLKRMSKNGESNVAVTLWIEKVKALLMKIAQLTDESLSQCISQVSDREAPVQVLKHLLSQPASIFVDALPSLSLLTEMHSQDSSLAALFIEQTQTISTSAQLWLQSIQAPLQDLTREIDSVSNQLQSLLNWFAGLPSEFFCRSSSMLSNTLLVCDWFSAYWLSQQSMLQWFDRLTSTNIALSGVSNLLNCVVAARRVWLQFSLSHQMPSKQASLDDCLLDPTVVGVWLPESAHSLLNIIDFTSLKDSTVTQLVSSVNGVSTSSQATTQLSAPASLNLSFASFIATAQTSSPLAAQFSLFDLFSVEHDEVQLDNLLINVTLRIMMASLKSLEHRHSIGTAQLEYPHLIHTWSNGALQKLEAATVGNVFDSDIELNQQPALRFQLQSLACIAEVVRMPVLTGGIESTVGSISVPFIQRLSELVVHIVTKRAVFALSTQSTIQALLMRLLGALLLCTTSIAQDECVSIDWLKDSADVVRAAKLESTNKAVRSKIDKSAASGWNEHSDSDSESDSEQSNDEMNDAESSDEENPLFALQPFLLPVISKVYRVAETILQNQSPAQSHVMAMLFVLARMFPCLRAGQLSYVPTIWPSDPVEFVGIEWIHQIGVLIQSVIRMNTSPLLLRQARSVFAVWTRTRCAASTAQRDVTQFRQLMSAIVKIFDRSQQCSRVDDQAKAIALSGGSFLQFISAISNEPEKPAQQISIEACLSLLGDCCSLVHGGLARQSFDSTCVSLLPLLASSVGESCTRQTVDSSRIVQSICQLLISLAARPDGTVLTHADISFVLNHVMTPIASCLSHLTAQSNLVGSLDQWQFGCALCCSGAALALALLQYRAPATHKHVPTLLTQVRAFLQFVLKSAQTLESNLAFSSQTVAHMHESLSFAADACSRLLEEAARSVHRVALGKYLPYFVSEYVSAVHAFASSGAPGVRRALKQAIFCVMDALTEEDMQYLFTSLNVAGKSLFKTMNQEYNNTHKFTGQV